jgi:hypothetical protein
VLFPAFDAWKYFGSVQATALTALRTRMGNSYSTVTDAEALSALKLAAAYLHGYTGRVFRPVAATLTVDGTGGNRLPLPLPVVSAGQLAGGGVTAITLRASDSESDDTDVDLELVEVNEGACWGPDDPRLDPVIRYRGASGRWPDGIGNVSVTATWGYVEADGSTPELILDCIARLCCRTLIPVDDVASQDDARAARVLEETTQGRHYKLSPLAVSGGLTGDRAIDQTLAHYRRPPAVYVSRSRRDRRSPWSI